MFVTREGGAEFTKPKQEVFNALLEAIPQIKGMKIKSQDEGTGEIVARAGVSLRSWGEDVPIVVSEVEPGKSFVRVTSKSRFGLIDWGKNKANLERVLKKTDEVLAARG